MPCTAGHFCVEGEVTPQPCAAGTYQGATGGSGQSACPACPAGSYCPAGASQGLACVAGTYQSTGGGSRQQDCLLCQPGTYSAQAGLTHVCSPCPEDYFCPTSTTLHTCPDHMTSRNGSYSITGCVCDFGWDCEYVKEIRASIRVNSSYADFTGNVGGVRSAFIHAVAQAAGVSADKVTIHSVTDTGGLRRRLLGLQRGAVGVHGHAHDAYADSIHVQASLKEAVGIRNLKRHLNSHAKLHLHGHTVTSAHVGLARQREAHSPLAARATHVMRPHVMPDAPK